MSEWKEVEFSKMLVDESISYGIVQPGAHTEINSIPIIRVNNIKNGYIKIDDVLKVEPSIEDKYKKTRLKGGELLITVVGSVGECAIVPDSLKGWNVARAVSVAKIKSEYDTRFIKYAFKTGDIIFQMYGNTNDTVQPTLNLSSLKTLKFNIPDFPEQTAIASVLSSLDDKIDLLHRQNATLEKMAETLFRQWFVEEEKEGWKEGILDDILTVKGGSTPITGEPAYWNGTIHWTSPRDITNLNGIYLFDTERKITKLGLSKISSGLLPKGTLLMSSRAPVGVLAFSEVPIAINQGYIAILDNKGYSKEFIYLWLKSNIDTVHSFSNGSTFMEISKSTFKTLQLLIPPKQTLNDFQLLVMPLFKKIKSNQTQIRTLTALRDTLLPKLMSGEVKINS